MDIKELENFKLSDAVKFHNKLNPALWDNEKLQPEVREQLLTIAKDLLSTLGVDDLAVKDIQISGSNAAYSYTPHSDLDLHVVVDMTQLPDDKIYKELFNAKKTIYNDKHDITVHNVPVELYVQDSNEPHVSLGEYSVLKDKWTKYPKKDRAHFNQYATKAKFENLKELVELALQSQDLDRVKKVIDIIKRYRQAGLAKGGEFGPENLAYKAIRTQGGIDDLYHLRDILHSEKLSIEESVNTKQDAINKILKMRNTAGRSPEEIKTINNIIKNLVSQYDIKPNEIEKSGSNIIPFSVQSNTPNTLDAKIAAAAYNKNLARQALEKEWQKTKDKVRSIWTEDIIDETAEDNKNIYLISKSIADYIIDIIGRKKNLLQLLYSKQDPMIEVVQGGIHGSEIPIYKTKDTGLNYVAKNMNYEVFFDKRSSRKTLGRADADYTDGPPRIRISIPAVKYTAKNIMTQDFKLQLISTIAHELQHALDDFLSSSRALKTTKQQQQQLRHSYDVYLKLPYEVNARFQEAMVSLGKLIADKQLQMYNLSSPIDFESIKSFIPKAIEYVFKLNKLDKLYKHDDPKYKRLVNRAYLFFMQELKNPSVNIDDFKKPETYMQRLKNFVFGKQDVTEGSNNITYKQQKGNNKFSVEMLVNGKSAGIFQYDANTGRTITELDPEFRGQGLGQRLILKGIYTAAMLGMDYVEDDSRTEMFDRAMDNLADAGYIVNDEEYWYVTDQGEQFLKQGVAEGEVVPFEKTIRIYNIDYDFDDDELEGPINVPSVLRAKVPVYLKGPELEEYLSDIISDTTGFAHHGFNYDLVKPVSEGASGYIPSNAEKNDPRFKTALTVDIKPDTMKKNAASFGNKISRAGIPPQARPDGKIK